MKILFSPSETKTTGGTKSEINENSFIFPELFKKRLEVVELYKDFIKKSDEKELSKLFGLKKIEQINYFKEEFFKNELKKVINRYTGVAFDYLKYEQLEKNEQSYIDKNVIIFSNLFGPLRAGDMGIPEYKLKQGEKIGEFQLEKHYNKYFSSSLDTLLEDEDIVDLRAGFYEKFYKINKPYYTMKFIKNGKVVSHWAKAYRGIILQQMAINNISTIEELINMKIDNLLIKEIQEKKFKTEVVFDII